MILDYKSKHIVLTEEENEDFLHVRKKTGIIFCESIANGKYVIPYVALSHLIKTIRGENYSITFTDNLKRLHANVIKRRKTLEALKKSSDIDNPMIAKVVEFIAEVESNVTGVENFKFTKEQIDTVIYGIFGKKVLIANEIGTGKTLAVNTIAKFLLKHKLVKKILVLMPATLVKNYYADYVKFFGPDGAVVVGKQTKVKRQKLYKQFISSQHAHFLITNYEKCHFDYAELNQVEFDMVIVDEFHIMKNFMSAKRSKNFFAMIEKREPKYRIPLTGTPIENRLFDLYPLFLLLNDGFVLGGENFFTNNFVTYETKVFRVKMKNGRSFLRRQVDPVGLKNTKFLKSLIRPFIIRKELHLPVDLYENFIDIEMSPKLKSAYEIVRDSTVGVSAKYHAVRQFLCDTERGEMKNNPRMDHLDNILDQTTSKVIIFSFYRCSIKAISKHLKKRKLPFISITGDDTKVDPLDIIEEFRTSDAKCLICTDVINFGHNIQFAKIIIHWEFPIKPTIYFQRNGRIYRKGQEDNVHSYVFSVNDSVESTIKEAFLRKRDIIQKMITELNTEGLEKIDSEFEAIAHAEMEKRKK